MTGDGNYPPGGDQTNSSLHTVAVMSWDRALVSPSAAVVPVALDDCMKLPILMHANDASEFAGD